MRSGLYRTLALVQMLRVELPIAAGVCVIAGEILALGEVPALEFLLFGFLTGFFISGAAMVSNDYFDIEVDRINHPDRPLPSGRVSVRSLVLFTIMLAAIGSISAAMLGEASFMVAVLTLVVGILYNWKIKEMGLLGNMTVAISVAMTFIYGGVAVGEPFNGMVWLFGLMAFIFDLGEEIASGAMDVKGDSVRSKRSVAIVKGKKFAIRAAVLLFLLFIALGFIPYLEGWVDELYLLLLIPTDIAGLYFILGLMRSDDEDGGRRMLRGLYLTVTVFVVLLIVNRII